MSLNSLSTEWGEAQIHPITVAWREVAVALVFGLVALVFAYPSRTGFIERRRGVLLLVLYAAYLATILQRQAAYCNQRL